MSQSVLPLPEPDLSFLDTVLSQCGDHSLAGPFHTAAFDTFDFNLLDLPVIPSPLAAVDTRLQSELPYIGSPIASDHDAETTSPVATEGCKDLTSELAASPTYGSDLDFPSFFDGSLFDMDGVACTVVDDFAVPLEFDGTAEKPLKKAKFAAHSSVVLPSLPAVPTPKRHVTPSRPSTSLFIPGRRGRKPGTDAALRCPEAEGMTATVRAIKCIEAIRDEMNPCGEEILEVMHGFCGKTASSAIAARAFEIVAKYGATQKYLLRKLTFSMLHVFLDKYACECPMTGGNKKKRGGARTQQGTAKQWFIQEVLALDRHVVPKLEEGKLSISACEALITAMVSKDLSLCKLPLDLHTKVGSDDHSADEEASAEV